MIADGTELKTGQRKRKLGAVINHLAALETTPRMEAAKERARARDAILDQMARNLTLIEESDSQAERSALIDANHELNRALKRLVADQLKEINESAEIADTLRKLAAATSLLVTETKKTKDAAQAIRTATAVVNMIAGVLTLLAPFL